ncbi:right-handed parallel beta-helix repeat-containing protein [Candidatus Bipolaricaulota bacterium]|nr:right-handed parallel beta-helix repeat-containing protein [Candidatus Bipolaricaulota bacterium]TFH10058.1 MAG: hypothetical protein E4H08_04460 [Candidatus Atribacteria bacterium]
MKTSKGELSMKRIIAMILLLGAAAFVLTACLPEELSVGDDTSTASSVDSSADGSAETVPAEVDATSATESGTAVTDENTEVPATSNAASEGIRGPISILGNTDFTAENGVVGGSGTADDPYVIAAWEIIVPAGEYYGVRIENVTAHFALRGLIIQNAAQMDGAGIRIGFASGGAIEGCSIANSMNGVVILSSTDISMENCVIYVSGSGLEVIGETTEQYRHQIAQSNLYNGLPIYYFYGLDGETISGLKGAHMTLAGSRNVTISNNELVNGDGLLLAFVEDSTVTLNLVHRTANIITEHGIHLYESSNNVISTNVIKNNRLAGIQLTLSDSNKILDNPILVNDTGVRVFASDGNEIRGNNIYGNVTGIALLGGASENAVLENAIGDDNDNMNQGISLTISLSNIVARNLIFGADTGILLNAQAFSNTLADNTVVAGGYGIYMEGTNNIAERNLLSQFSRGIMFPETFQRSTTKGNTFRGNVLADNGNHVYTNLDSTGNVFTGNAFLNDGRVLVDDKGTGNSWTQNGRGNYWGFRSVTDNDGDGIGDRPITVPSSGVDDTAPLASINALDLGLGIVGTLELSVVTIETRDGDTIEIAAYVADTDYSRMTGFRGFPSELITGFPGILFAFDSEKDETAAGSGFTMQTVPFDLDIAFFSAEGDWAGSTTMVAQTTAIYKAGAPYMYALELPAGSLADLGIGAGSALVLP